MEKYDETSIKVLDEITHVRKNPGMYIGHTENPIHLIEEAFDNALDECVNNHATIAAVTIDTPTNTCCIIDNGRGIPIKDDVPKTISTKLFSGAKFNDEKESYGICSGLHGIGLVCVNALSKNYQIEIYRDNTYAIYKFEYGIFKSKKVENYDGEKPYSTKICFVADDKIFENQLPDINRIRQRMLNASVELPNAAFILYVDGNKEIIKLDKEVYFKNECLTDNDTDISNIFDFNVDEKIEKFGVKFCYSYNGSNIPKISSSVNLLPVEQGGIHVTIFQDILRDYFLQKMKKYNFHFLPQDCFCGLRVYFSLSLINPSYIGQTKDRLSNKRSEFIKLSTKLKNMIEGYFNKNEEDLKFLLEHFSNYRKKQDSKKLKNNVTHTRRGSTKFTKLRDCVNSNGELFLVEGESAGGSLISCRDPLIHAILPLKGKIPSVVNKKDILKNTEIKELIESVGAGIEPHFDISKIRYSKIIVATDADPDGAHISSLMIMVFAILMPEIIKQGFLYIADTPLYAIKEKKNFIPIWTSEELETARKNNSYILRIKGLGELNSNEAKQVLIDTNNRKLIKVDFSEDIEKIVGLFSDVMAKRELLENESIVNQGEY